MTTTLWCTIQGKCSCSSVQNVFVWFFFIRVYSFLFMCVILGKLSPGTMSQPWFPFLIAMLWLVELGVWAAMTSCVLTDSTAVHEDFTVLWLKTAFCDSLLRSPPQTSMNLHTVPGCVMQVSRWAAIPMLFTSSTYLVWMVFILVLQAKLVNKAGGLYSGIYLYCNSYHNKVLYFF